MINNFKKIKALMKFQNKEDFYFIQVIKRRKDNPGLPRDMKRIAEYFVYSMKYLEEHEDSIINEAILNNARVYIHLHRRNSRKTALKTMMIIADYLDSGSVEAAKTAYTTACGKQHSDKEKKWILDVDTQDEDTLKKVVDHINDCDPKGKKVIEILPTKNGVHVVTSPFRKDKFGKLFPDIGINQDSPTVLFIP